MRSKDDLHHLVQAMSKSEKRYFVLDAKKSGRSASRYLSLFEAINAMEEYDEEALKQHFPKNLSSDKAYLYDAILRSMRDYRSKSSKAAQVKERLMDAKYLYERGLYQQSGDRIMEAKALAKELEDNFSLLEIIREEQLSLFDRRVRVGLEQIEKLQEEKEMALRGVQEELEYIGLYFRLAVEFYKHGVLKDESGIQQLNNKLPLAMLEEANKPKSPLALRRFFLCKANYYRLIGDNSRTNLLYQQAVNWWQEFPAIKEEEFYRFVGDVTNLINTCYSDETLYSLAKEWLLKIKGEEAGKNYHEQKYIFLSVSVSNLLHIMNKGDIVSTKKELPIIIEDLDKFGLKKSVLLLVNIVTGFFWVKDYKNCIKWADQLISLKNNTRTDIQKAIMLYKLVALYELGNVDETESWFRSVNRFFAKNKVNKDSFENVVLNTYLKRIFNSPINELKGNLSEFKNYLKNILADPKIEITIGAEELLIWAGQKS
jgi:hypothetical protein